MPPELPSIFLSCNYVVKTLESPRDLQVPPEITQYGPLEGSMEASADILLLVRPDYTIYDEVRKTRDFQVFADMRLAGVGMIGVVHANKPIDALQRLLGRVDMGMIPQVVDTVVFIEKGEVTKVLDVEFVVKVPIGHGGSGPGPAGDCGQGLRDRPGRVRDVHLWRRDRGHARIQREQEAFLEAGQVARSRRRYPIMCEGPSRWRCSPTHLL